jgi:hypothetical protein
VAALPANGLTVRIRVTQRANCQAVARQFVDFAAAGAGERFVGVFVNARRIESPACAGGG